MVYTGDGHKNDGCAIFFRRSRFSAVARDEIVFSDIAYSSSSSLAHKRLLKDNIAQILLLQFMDDEATAHHFGSTICVANTHIHSSEHFKDVKLWQIATLINELEEIASHLPILLCGDLNSLPGSAPLELLLSGRVGPDHKAFPDDPIGIFNHLKLSHNLHLGSVYPDLLLNNALFPQKQRKTGTWETQFTNFSTTSVGVLDHIFYSVNKLRLLALLEPLDAEYIAKNTTLPSPEWSSDHIALMADFCLIPQPKAYHDLQITYGGCQESFFVI